MPVIMIGSVDCALTLSNRHCPQAALAHPYPLKENGWCAVDSRREHEAVLVIEPQPVNKSEIHRLDRRHDDAAQTHQAFRPHHNRGEKNAGGGKSGGSAGGPIFESLRPTSRTPPPRLPC